MLRATAASCCSSRSFCTSCTARAPTRETLSWPEWHQLLGSRGSAPLLKRLFDVLDADAEGLLRCRHFVAGLRCVTPEVADDADEQPDEHTRSARLDFLFQLMDLEGAGAISRASLLVLLRATEGLALGAARLEQLVDATFGQACLDADGRLGRRAFGELMGAGAATRLLRTLMLDVGLAVSTRITGSDETWLQPGQPAEDALRSPSLAQARAGSASCSARP